MRPGAKQVINGFRPSAHRHDQVEQLILTKGLQDQEFIGRIVFHHEDALS